VTRAQEAEENYLIKRELATIKQQSNEASAKLEQAESTIRKLQHQQQWVRSLLAPLSPFSSLPCKPSFFFFLKHIICALVLNNFVFYFN
jgi:predicted metal-dependent enzyme (double-stranded beta helix superfamily)